MLPVLLSAKQLQWSQGPTPSPLSLPSCPPTPILPLLTPATWLPLSSHTPAPWGITVPPRALSLPGSARLLIQLQLLARRLSEALPGPLWNSHTFAKSLPCFVFPLSLITIQPPIYFYIFLLSRCLPPPLHNGSSMRAGILFCSHS